MTTILDSLLSAVPHLAPSTVSLDQWRHGVDGPAVPNLAFRPPVPNSEDLERILKLPRRPQVDLTPGSDMAEALVQIMNERLRRPDWQRTNCKCASLGRKCITTLQPSQAWSLYEAPLAGGLLGHLAVGSGKTALDFLMPLVMKSKLAVLFIPPRLKQQLLNEYELWREHWLVPSLMHDMHKGWIIKGRPVVHVIAYSRLSMPESTKLLKDLNPDLIVSDEVHFFKNHTSARVARFGRHMAEAPSTKFTGWSGTVTSKSLNDYGHLSAYALRAGSPLPLDPNVVASWALAIDPNERPAAAGALRKFCEPFEDLEQGFHRRLVETLGVVATRAGAIGTTLNLFERTIEVVPAKVLALLDSVREEWVRPDGEELVDALEVAANARQIASGFFYRWKFLNIERDATGSPTKESVLRIEDWFAKRKAWRRELRDKLKAREEHLDSEFLCTMAAVRAYQVPSYDGELPVWRAQNWLPWMRVKDTVEHETEAVWVDDFFVLDCVDWLKKHRGVCWYEHDAVGKRIGELSGLPVHGGGPGAEERILAERGDRSIIASIRSHGTGRDGLQRIFYEQYIANPPASGEASEQLLGRLHRVGQEAEEVNTWVPRHTEELRAAIDRAISHARYVYGTVGSDQKLLIANCDFRLT